MFDNRMSRLRRQAELLQAGDSLPVLSAGLRSRVLAAALEAQDRRAQGRRLLASALGLFSMLAGVAWLGPFSDSSFIASDAAMSAGSASDVDGQFVSETLADVNIPGDGTTDEKTTGKKAAGATATSALSSFNRGRNLMSVMGDDWRSVEDQLRSRQEHFPRSQM